MVIIAVSHQKGGVGKTTLTLNIALCYASEAKVAIFDTDPQGSLSSIAPLVEGVDILPYEMYGGKNLKNLRSLDYDVLLIDTPPYLTDQLAEIYSISNFVLVPSKVSYVDIMAVRSTIAMVETAKRKNPALKAGLVLNMVKSSSSINKEIGEIIEGLEIDLMDTKIGDRVSYNRSLILNGVAHTEDEKAKNEISDLAREILIKIR